MHKTLAQSVLNERTVRKMVRGRMEQAFQKFLWKNDEYSTNQRFVMSREEYHVLFEKLKEKLSGSRERTDSFTKQDMIHLIFMYDAFRDLCTVLLGTVIVPELNEGVAGVLVRSLSVIEAHIPEEKKGEDDPEYDRILHDSEKSPEERAEELLFIKRSGI